MTQWLSQCGPPNYIVKSSTVILLPRGPREKAREKEKVSAIPLAPDAGKLGLSGHTCNNFLGNGGSV